MASAGSDMSSVGGEMSSRGATSRSGGSGKKDGGRHGKKKTSSQEQNIYSHLPMDKKAQNKLDRSVSDASRPCEEHSFLTDVADVREMEQGLLGLLDDFHSGKLRAYGGGGTFDKMDQIREQQEKLARLHFEMDMQQDMHRLNSDEARKAANDNLSKLINQLHSLSTSILFKRMTLDQQHRLTASSDWPDAIPEIEDQL